MLILKTGFDQIPSNVTHPRRAVLTRPRQQQHGVQPKGEDIFVFLNLFKAVDEIFKKLIFQSGFQSRILLNLNQKPKIFFKISFIISQYIWH